MSCAHVREELGGYVLGALEPDEHKAVAAHLATCPTCAAEHARLAGLPALLHQADGIEIPDPPPAIAERVLDRVARDRKRGRRGHAGMLGLLARPRSGAGRRRRRRGFGLTRGRAAIAAAVVCAALLGAGVTALVLDRDTAPPAGQYALRLNGATGATARAELQPGRGGTELHLWVKGLPPGAKAVYEVRCERPGWSASAGTFRADAHGRAYVVLTTAARIGEYERIRVVRRSEPRDDDVMSGEIQ
jgi:anti-sigma factor RsiW